MVKEILALKAWDLLNSIDNSVIVDTRTTDEWSMVGTPVLSDRVVRISSHLKPNMILNERFLSELKEEIKDFETSLFFLCRTSGRAKIAAELARSAGYKNCYLITDGFEGSDKGPGWKDSNIPFIYYE